MARPISNPGLAALCREQLDDPRNVFDLIDVAIICKCHRNAITLYSTGRKACPTLERKLAGAFRITVPALRRRLGLPALPREKVLPPIAPPPPRQYHPDTPTNHLARGASAFSVNPTEDPHAHTHERAPADPGHGI